MIQHTLGQNASTDKLSLVLVRFLARGSPITCCACL